jgi:hypothetical protein
MKYSLRSLMTFSIRDLLWLMVVAAILTAWWVDRTNLRAGMRRLWLKVDIYERSH